MRGLMFALALACAGCAGYSWKSSVPEDMRTVSVPMFRNESDVTELGAKVTQQTLREFQREGTFSIASHDDAAIEVQGTVVKSTSVNSGAARDGGTRYEEFRAETVAKVSIVDRRNGKVLVDNRVYKANTTFTAADDRMTAERDASGRLAEELARQIVDDATRLW